MIFTSVSAWFRRGLAKKRNFLQVSENQNFSWATDLNKMLLVFFEFPLPLSAFQRAPEASVKRPAVPAWPFIFSGQVPPVKFHGYCHLGQYTKIPIENRGMLLGKQRGTKGQ